MSLWDFDSIKDEIRGLTMKRSLNQLSDVSLSNRINQYLWFKFPQEVNPPELHDLYEFVTIADTQSYTIDQDKVVSFDGSVFISETDTIGSSGNVYTDADLYWSQFPTVDLISSQNGEPTDFLLYSGLIYVTVIPDGIYYIKMPCIIRPTLFSNPTDVPTANGRSYDEWGSVIAHGAAVDILEKTGEDDRLNQVLSWYEREKRYLKKKIVFQSASKRPMHRF